MKNTQTRIIRVPETGDADWDWLFPMLKKKWNFKPALGKMCAEKIEELVCNALLFPCVVPSVFPQRLKFFI